MNGQREFLPHPEPAVPALSPNGDLLQANQSLSRRAMLLGTSAACLTAALPVAMNRLVMRQGWILMADDI